jgi:hypothetical protein
MLNLELDLFTNYVVKTVSLGQVYKLGYGFDIYFSL